MKKIANVIIIAGLLVFLYPLLDRAYTWYWQQKILQSWEANMPAVEDRRSRERPPGEVGAGAEQPEPPLELPANALGIIGIEKIDLRIPIIEGASLANLKIGAGLMAETAAFGEPGNTVLTAHRSYTYGRFFNRLDEVEIGDEITVDTFAGAYCYIVYDKEIVKPNDPSILESPGGEEKEDILTLVTCHPIRKATHRLIIRARPYIWKTPDACFYPPS